MQGRGWIFPGQGVPGFTSKGKEGNEGFTPSVQEMPADAEVWPFSRCQVVALTLLMADGTLLECSESSNAHVFQAGRVHLGCLGVILTITLQCVPQFHLQETSFPSTLREVLASCLPSASENKWRMLASGLCSTGAPCGSAGSLNGGVG